MGLKVKVSFKINGKIVRKTVPVISKVNNPFGYWVVGETERLALLIKKPQTYNYTTKATLRILVKNVCLRKPLPKIGKNELKKLLIKYVKLRGGDPETLSFELI